METQIQFEMEVKIKMKMKISQELPFNSIMLFDF